MVFFLDFNLDKNLKIGITNLLGNITTKPDSHKGGWAKLLRCQLINEGYNDVTVLSKNEKLNDFDIIIFDLGAEFSGGLNLFGGLDQKVLGRLLELREFDGRLFSWQHDLPDIMTLSSRANNNSTCKEALPHLENGLIEKVHYNLLRTSVFHHVARKSKVLIGDSHTPSVWTPEYMIERRDGRTLKGMLEHNTVEKILERHREAKCDIEEVMIYAGNIDIRHHLLREENPWNEVQKLASKLLTEIPPRISGVIASLLPIENESRKLPKTGYFKGTPFYGTWKERSAAVEIFNNILNENEQGIIIYNHPKTFYNDKGELSFDVMERPQSVHLSPMHYRWDLDNNKLRY